VEISQLRYQPWNFSWVWWVWVSFEILIRISTKKLFQRLLRQPLNSSATSFWCGRSIQNDNVCYAGVLFSRCTIAYEILSRISNRIRFQKVPRQVLESSASTEYLYLDWYTKDGHNSLPKSHLVDILSFLVLFSVSTQFYIMTFEASVRKLFTRRAFQIRWRHRGLPQWLEPTLFILHCWYKIICTIGTKIHFERSYGVGSHYNVILD